MPNEFRGSLERHGEWFIAYSPEIRGANWLGESKKAPRPRVGRDFPHPCRPPRERPSWASGRRHSRDGRPQVLKPSFP
jgi:hypothetical protein